ncbi:MAG: tetratricopeptide repeat protein [Treponema sp.]|jgi:tetratricopeptide (TPR) repeat protein|nr:tetratricopeptide repeat protein [Treponema sp.]
MKIPYFTALIFFLAVVTGFSQTNFSQGEELFLWNRTAEAAVYLERAVAEDPGNARAFLYLGISYEHLNRPDDAIAVYQRILDQAGELTVYVANNLGNVHFSRGNSREAERYYTRAIEADSSFPSAWLGRANTRLKTFSLETAANDYEQYLSLEPDSPQGDEIQRLIELIRAELAAMGPPITESAIAEFAVTEFAIVEFGVAESAITGPAVTESAVVEFAVAESAIAQPAVTESAVAQPAIVEFTVTQPAVVEFTVTESAVAQPAIVESAVAEQTHLLPDEIDEEADYE